MWAKLDDFEIMSRLGVGAYSSVYKVKRISDSQTYALKKVRMQNLATKEKENALNEVRILASISNPNIISYKEAFIDEDTHALWIIMEYADDGDLFQKIVHHQKNATWFKEEFIWRIFIKVVRGLKALHDLDIMHRDIKSANVFLNTDGSGLLGDMNVSKVAEKGLSYTQTGTPYYASPEVWRDEAYDVKSDIWSLGWVLYEMIALKPPFRAENMQGLYKKVLRGNYPKISKQYSSDIQTIIKSLLQVSSKKRPNWSEILGNPIVKKKIKSILKEDDFDSESETENFKDSLLKTIYFPKNGQDILYLTDQLPKPSYDKVLAKEVDRHKMSLRTRAISESPGLNYPKEHLSNGGSYKYKKKAQDMLSKKSTVPETKEDSELPSVKVKNNLSLKQQNNNINNKDKSKNKSKRSNTNSNSYTNNNSRLPEVNPSSSEKDKSQLTSIERIALRLETESKKKPLMNIDKEYSNLQKILGRKQMDYEKESGKVSVFRVISLDLKEVVNR